MNLSDRLLAVIAEPFECYDAVPVEEDGVGMEFFEPAGDWRALLAEFKRLRMVEERAIETLERIRDHANSAEDPALLAQHELNRIQRKNPA